MEWTESIREIQKAQENNQLVIFVGAGVSKNSGVPTWGELIKKFADAIHYERCSFCSYKTEDCKTKDCKKRYAYTQNEYLRIPEYYYQQDSSKDKKNYYELIKNTLNCDKEPNPIDDEIFSILPHHIITTNYDELLEKSNAVNAQFYTVVSEDSDLLSKSSERYIIKMHGDIKRTETIVLRESDYIDYEQKHPLISTFIRSLLINHTFMFLGYSLNDYNLNLIIGWINYFRKLHNVEKSPHNFLLATDTPSEFEKKRLEDKSIFIIDINSLPTDIEKEVSIPQTLTNFFGRKMFSYLKYISNSQLIQNYIPLAEILAEKYQILNSYNKISYEDLIQVQPLGYTEFTSTELEFYDKNWYENIANLIDKKDRVLIDTFNKAGISGIHFYTENSGKDIPTPSESNDELFQLYLNNNYTKLFDLLQSSSNIAQKIYYYHLLKKNPDEISALINAEGNTIMRNDYIAILLHKMRSRLISLSNFDKQGEVKTGELEQIFATVPIKYRNSITFLKMLFESDAKNMQKMEKLLDKQKDRNKYNNKTVYFDHSFTNIWKIQAFAYDYYFFFKENYLPFDYFSDPKNYLSYYLKAILCSYSPAKSVSEDTVFAINTDRRPYLLGEVEIDMFVKYTDARELRSWIKKYSVQKLMVDQGIDLIKKYEHLCESLVYFKYDDLIEEIFCFSIILCLVDMDNESKQKILKSTVMLFEKLTQYIPRYGELLFESVDYLIKHLTVRNGNDEYAKLLDALLSGDVYSSIIERHSQMYSELITKLAPFLKEQTKNSIIADINLITAPKAKCNKICLLRKLLPMNNYKDYLRTHISIVEIEDIFDLVIEKIIPYDENTTNIFINKIKSEDRKRKATPGIRFYPDYLMITIDDCLILNILDFDMDLSLLRPYAHYSEHLQFMLSPEEYDYTKVDTSNYMWQNLIYSKKYQQFFINHKQKLLSKELKNIFSLGNETAEQQKIVYGILLKDSDELQRF